MKQEGRLGCKFKNIYNKEEKQKSTIDVFAGGETEGFLDNQAREDSDVDDSSSEIKEIRQRIEMVETFKQGGLLEVDTLEKANKIKNYIEKHIPEHLRDNKTSLVYDLFKNVSKLALKDVIGKENLPDKQKLIISSHRGGESGRLIAALDRPVHISAAQTINWEGKGLLFQKILEKLGMVPIRETFSNLNEEQKKEAIKKSPVSERNEHEIATKSKGQGNIQNIKSMVALLLRNEDVAIFAEGAFSRLEGDERRAYAGYALIAREYKRVTGEDLDIIPAGIRNGKVSFGESFHIDEEEKMSKEQLQDIATQKIHSLYDSLR